MANRLPELEDRRMEIQAALDAAKSQAERNRLGQFATPHSLALEMLEYAKGVLPQDAQVRFLDPGFGTGSFFSALLETFPPENLSAAVGFEIDPHYGVPSAQLWRGTPLDLRLSDFTAAEPPTGDNDRANLVICNPPYVRHHHIVNGEKARLQEAARRASGVHITGLTGLYCYFMALAHAWLADGGLAAWLIPSEFMDVNYGKAIKQYLLDRVTLLRIHRFDPAEVQFDDALVSSAVVWFWKNPPPHDHAVQFTFGGTLSSPDHSIPVPVEVLRHEPKWSRFPLAGVRELSAESTLGDFFTIKRGLATGDNKFFILSMECANALHLPEEVLTPILPSPRYVPGDEIPADDLGNPTVDRRLVLVNCSLPEVEVESRYPSLWSYLQTGVPDTSARYLCRMRTPWYAQENRPVTPLLCTYMGRSGGGGRGPFRFILNHSRAIAANVYLMLYPKRTLADALEAEPQLIRKIWEMLNATCPKALMAEGRTYGGGLHKLEPRELSNLPADWMVSLLGVPSPPRADEATRTGKQATLQQSLFH